MHPGGVGGLTRNPALTVASLSADFFGDKICTSKPPNTTGMYFQNVNGLHFIPSGGDFTDTCAKKHEANIDILGIAETKLDTYLFW
jgi:hypothetical protein